MSTRSNIGRRNHDGTITSIYCHFDGYPEGAGAMLAEHWCDSAKVDELMELGNISSLSELIGEKHPFDSPSDARKWTRAYGRDRGETGVAAKVTDPGEHWRYQEYAYLWDGERWLWSTGADRWDAMVKAPEMVPLLPLPAEAELDVASAIRALIPHVDDYERVHIAADTLLLTALREAGRGDVADAYEELQDEAGAWPTA